VAALVPWGWFLVRDRDPLLDLVAIGLPVIVAAVVAVSVLTSLLVRRWPPVVVTTSWLVFGMATIVGPWVPLGGAAPPGGIRVVAANTFGRHTDAGAVAEELTRRRAEVAVISELDWSLDELLSARYRRAVRSEPVGSATWPEVGAYTDLPVTDLGLPPELAGQAGVRLRVDGPDGPFVLYGLHLERPTLGRSDGTYASVRRHASIIDALHDAVAAEELPVVVAGDLNLVDRTSGYRLLTSVLDDAMRSGWVRPTARKRITLPLLGRVDHVLMPAGWCSTDAAIFTLTGSDHQALAATIGPCPEPGL
jgi:endonuclease/exonuclease/phosphatase (EEP) superfamily protein YafD